MTYGDIQQMATEAEKRYYVYIWYFFEQGQLIPFYVGMGSGKRYKNRNNRSETFKMFLKKHPNAIGGIVAWELAQPVAREVERRIKEELKKRGFNIIDAEDDKQEKKRRAKAGIDAMPVVNGKRISSKSGRPIGRPLKVLDYSLNAGETVTSACKRLGISRTQWYRAVAENGGS